MQKKAMVAIGLGAILLTSLIGALNLPIGTPPEINKIKDMERKHEQQLDFIQSASESWEAARMPDEAFLSVIDQSIIDTESLVNEYYSMDLPDRFDKYRRLSIESLNTQRSAFEKLREYVQTRDPQVRAEVDQLLISSFNQRDEALKELN